MRLVNENASFWHFALITKKIFFKGKFNKVAKSRILKLNLAFKKVILMRRLNE
jgi:hypothetical protein